MSERERQIQRLARRINWLDRFRRPISVFLATLVAIALMWKFAGWVPTSWPGGHIIALAAMLTMVCWYAIETVLGFVMALWETNYSTLTRPASLPRAEVVRRK